MQVVAIVSHIVIWLQGHLGPCDLIVASAHIRWPDVHGHLYTSAVTYYMVIYD